MIVLKFWLGYTNKEIAKELSISKQDVEDYLMNGLALIREILDSEIEPVINAAIDITNTASRSDFLRKHCLEDKDLLRDLEIILKERLKKE